MAATKKTLKVARLVSRANLYLEFSPDNASAQRIFLHNFVSGLLHDNSCYAGFGYLQPCDEPGSDKSRTFFYLHHKAQ